MRRILLLVLVFFSSTIARAQSTTGALLVLNKNDATMAIVDPSTGAVTGAVPVGQGPHELVTSDDGKWAFASNYGTGPAPGRTISMIDVAAKKELRRIDVSPLERPHGLAFAGGKLYFTAETNKTIARYDPAADKIDWKFETGQNATHMVLITKDQRTIFTANVGSDNISAIERGAGGDWRQTLIPVGKGPEGNDLTPDGKQLWAANSRGGSVSIVDVASKRAINTLDIGTKRSNRIKFTRDGKFALVSDDEAGELVVIDVASRQVTKRISLGKNAEGIVMAPDGARAFVAVNGDNVVAVVDLKSWQVTKRIASGNGPDGMAWAK
ncbi:MAG TPA: YncE family protein [Vicinamibacterales bacterium]|jgi:DNA-binding beta-propeller fold protein YncE|nr:YncE family protein [Vicinamibacterales bacterium]